MGLLKMTQTAVSQQPGCVVEPSYVRYCCVLGSRELSGRCLMGNDDPGWKVTRAILDWEEDLGDEVIRVFEGIIVMRSLEDILRT